MTDVFIHCDLNAASVTRITGLIHNVSDQPRGLVVNLSCLLIVRSRVRFPALPWEFSLKGRIPAVTMLWVSWYNLGLRALLALHPSISPLTSSWQRNCASWVSQTQKSVTLLSWTGGRTAKSTRTRGGIGPKKKSFPTWISPNFTADIAFKLIDTNEKTETKQVLATLRSRSYQIFPPTLSFLCGALSS